MSQKVDSIVPIATAKAGLDIVENGSLADMQRVLEGHREVFNFMEQGAAVWSAENNCTLVNARFYELCNLTPDDLFVGMSLDDYYEKLVANPNAQISWSDVDSIKYKLKLRTPFAFDRSTREGRTLSVVVRPLATGGHVGTFTDVTEMRSYEASLLQAMQRAEKAELKARETLAFESERKQEANRLSEFGDWLQSCKTITELYEVVRQAMLGIYPGSSGELFVYSNSRDILESVCSWGVHGSSVNIQPQDCWALRRGRVYRYGDGMINFPCNHFAHSHLASQSDDTDVQGVDQRETEKPRQSASERTTRYVNDDNAQLAYLCLPIVAHGDTVGLMHLDMSDLIKEDEKWSPFSAENLAFTSRCAEQISMAVANVKLRDELHEQSTRDPLTNLFNRRYFLERCRSEIIKAEYENSELAFVVFDADNFKQFNDRFGHDAGDMVLCNIADQVQQLFCRNEVSARMGGEEFAVLIPGLSKSRVQDQVQQLIDTVSRQKISYLNKSLPSVSVSAGIAMFGEHGKNLTELVRLADQAMYKAKDAGKNQMMVA